jgi:hypothetical protein
MKYIDFNDPKIPIGKRKQAYVKWAISKGTDPIKAKKQANDKFGFEQKEGLLAIVWDNGRMHQRSFTGDSEIFSGRDTRKYKKTHWIHADFYIDSDRNKEIIKEYSDMGWDVIHTILCG